MNVHAREPGWFNVVWLLLRAAQRRSRARSRAAAVRRRGGAPQLLYVFVIMGAIFIEAIAAGAFTFVASTADDALLERTWSSTYGVRFPVAQSTIAAIRAPASSDDARTTLSAAFTSEVDALWKANGGSRQEWHERLKQRAFAAGSAGFVSTGRSPGNGYGDAAYRVLGLLLSIWWISLVLQGEGVNFDLQRRRHPMWEWYLSFPVPPGAVFAAEALTPALINPYLLASPALFAVLVGVLGGSVVLGVSAIPLAVPFIVAAALWAKALEMLIMLRVAARNRSAWFALYAAIGFVTMFAPLLVWQLRAHIGNETSVLYRAVRALGDVIVYLPNTSWLLAYDDVTGWLAALAGATALGFALAMPALLLIRVATARGLEGGFGSTVIRSEASAFSSSSEWRTHWFSDPLLRKEWLWIKRDRGALIQLLVVPLALVSFQFFNLRNMLVSANMSWNRLAAVVVGMGAYMLFIAAPRALVSEGPALTWMLTWPRSLEDTLRAKVRLLFALVSAIVFIALAVIAWMFPADTLNLVGVALVWSVFGMAVAEKAITLIRAPSQSGEPEPVPHGQQWAAGLGNLSLAIALFTAQWQLVFAATILNWVFAAALWQRFKVRLIYLFDPDCEPHVQPPTVLSSVLAVVGMLELGALISGLCLAFFGKDAAGFGLSFGYTIAALVTCVTVIVWQGNRDVGLRAILLYDVDTPLVTLRTAALGIALGAVLGAIAIGYNVALHIVPWPQLQDLLQQSRAFLAAHPDLRIAYAFAAVAIAPWAEEFLFRGLLFRAMSAHWKTRHAVLLSSAFFAVLHPWPAWPMVFALGAVNAHLFNRSRKLLPCVLLHACYNAVVIVYASN